MAYQPVPRVAQVELRAIYQDSQVENVYHFKRASDIDQEGLDELTYTFNAWALATLIPDYPNSLSVTEIYAADLTTADGFQSTNTSDMPASGAVTSPGLPANVTLAVSLRTAFRGRTRRGRHYWLALTEGGVTDKTVSDATIAVILGDLETLVGPGTLLAGWTWGVVSRVSDGVVREEGLFTPITNVTVVDKRVDTMRGRLR